MELKTPDALNLVTGLAANMDLKAFVGQECTVAIALEGKGSGAAGGIGAGVREISGIVTGARVVRPEGRSVLYALTLRPWLWLATRTTDYKIFQNKSVTDILDAVLGEYGFPVEKRLAGSYPPREYQVQYGESDFDFAQRLMQEWGIYWFFDHADGKHRLILCDHLGAHRPFSSAAYQTLSVYPNASKVDEEYLASFDVSENLTSGAWVTNDFDFTKPLADLTAMSRQPRETAHADNEVYEWPGDYAQPGEGDAIARVRMEEQRAAGARARGEGNVRAVVPGCTFTLANHPHETANTDYLIVGARLELEDISEETGFQQYRQHVVFEARPTAESYRPERTVPKPRTRGPQTATVAGPAGQEIWTDKYGRVKVQFHWDRYGANDENSSCWVRVSHPWAGSNFGAIHLPRIGQEVVVDFLNGDPDLPLITGRVYNAVNMPPWALPANATQSGVLTRSSKGGSEANANALRFEDKKGAEQVWLHAEKNQDIEVENDESHWVGNDRSKTIDNNETVHVGNNRTESVGNNEQITIGNNQDINVRSNQSTTVQSNQSLTVMAERNKKVMGSESDIISASWGINIGGVKNESVGGNNTQKVSKNSMEVVGIDKQTAVGASYTISAKENITTTSKTRNDNIQEIHESKVDEDWKIAVKKQFKLTVDDNIEIICGDSSLKMDKKGNITLKGKKLVFQSSESQTIKSSGEITIKGKQVKEN